MLRRFGKWIGIAFVGLLLLVVIVSFLLTRENVQTYLAKETVAYFSKKLNTKISIKKVRIDFLSRVHLEQLYIEDQQKDTLAFIGDFAVSTSSIWRNYWHDETYVIKNVELQDGVVRLLRSKNSERWNYTFIEEAFAGPKTNDTSTVELPKLDIKKLAVEHVLFSMRDKWGGEDIESEVGTLKLLVKEFDLQKKQIHVEKLQVDNTQIIYRDYNGGKPPTAKHLNQSNWGTPFNAENLIIQVEDIVLSKLQFEFQNGNQASTSGLFDEQHIVANDINTKIQNLNVLGDTLRATIASFSAKERCGIEVKKLQANVVLNQQLAELNQLYLKTNWSEVGDYYSMHYTNFHSFNDYIAAVHMNSHFKNSKVDKRDIEFFAGPVSQLPNITSINGIVEGTVDDLYSPNILLHAGTTLFEGNARLVGLPDIDNTYFTLHALNLQTTGEEVVRFAPEANVDEIKWNALTNIHYKGSFIGTIQQFGATGFLATNHGNAEVDLKMDFSQKEPKYDAIIRTEKLNLGKILKQDNIGIVSLKGKIKGQGFDFENVNSKVDADIVEIDLQGERYQNLTVHGILANKKFEGLASSKDPQLGFDFAGSVDFNNENATYSFRSDIQKINLKRFGITPQDAIVSAKVNFNFKGKTIDDFIGEASLSNVTVLHSNQAIKIPFAKLTSSYKEFGYKVLKLESSIADASMEGQFTVRQIPKAVQSFLHYYLPQYIKETTLAETENLRFNLLVKDANDLIGVFEPDAKIGSGAVIEGSLNTQQQLLDVNGDIPQISFKDYQLENLSFISKGDYGLLTTSVSADKFTLNKEDVLSALKMDVQMAQDTGHLVIKTKPSSDVLGDAIFECRATASNNDLYVNLLPSSFIVKDDKWNLRSAHPIILTNRVILLAKEVIVENGTQQITLNSFENGSHNDAKIGVRNFDLERLSAYLKSDDYVYKARVDADIDIKNIWGETLVDGKVFTGNALRLNDDTLGFVNLDFFYEKAKNKLQVKEGSSLTHGDAYAKTSGTIDFNENLFDLEAHFKETPIQFLNQLLIGNIEDIEGFTTGNISVKGDFKTPTVLGHATLDKTKLKVVFTGCTYRLESVKLAFNNSAITFDPFEIYDERSKPGKALVTGKITHQDFDKYRLNLKVNSDNFLSLNTNEKSGELFYGSISSEVEMKVTGTLKDVTMDIKAKPLENSKFYLPIASSGDAGTYDYIKFKSVGRFQAQEKKLAQETYFKVNMNIEATPNIEAYIILDQNTGEKIIAKGDGDILLTVDLGNDIKMYNSYRIKEGKYLFNLRGLLEKEFVLDEGGTITWNGDPYNAQLNLSAIYKTNLSLYPLISNDVETNQVYDEDVKQARNSYPTDVTIFLKGPLSTPEITFDINQPQNTNVGSMAYSRLQSIRNDQNELIYQAGMILLFNAFRPIQGNVAASNLLSSTGASTVSDVVGSYLSPILNNVINKITGKQNLSINLDYKNYSTDMSNQSSAHNQFNIGFTGSILNDKIQFDGSSSFDYANGGVGAANGNLTYGGDFRAYYNLTADSRLRLNAFGVSRYDYVRGQPTTKGGLGIMYKKVFNHWGDLFKRPERNQSVTEIDNTPTGVTQ